MKRVIKTKPLLWEKIKKVFGCGEKQSSGKACREAEKEYKIKGGKYKRVKFEKDLKRK